MSQSPVIRQLTEKDIKTFIRPLLDEFYGGPDMYSFPDEEIRRIMADRRSRLMTDGTNLAWVQVVPDEKLVLIRWGFPTCSTASTDRACRDDQFRLMGTCFLSLAREFPEIRSYRWAADLAGDKAAKAEWWRGHVERISAGVIDDTDYGRSVGGNMGEALDMLEVIVGSR